MRAAVQYELGALLEMIGARLRGRNRADCPECKRFRAVSFTDETFFCHGCQWKGNAVTLANELGIYRRIPSAEYREQSRKRERTSEAACRLYSLAHQRQLELREVLRELGRLELAAHHAGPTEEAWEILSTVYAERPAIEQELDALESGDPAAVFANLMREP